ncbi:MAG: hypothetical protein HY901_04550 [Deltaproteobacteria bacterium]|nr:hypothetical protein [Deltaproteobacteria bacterium]
MPSTSSPTSALLDHRRQRAVLRLALEGASRPAKVVPLASREPPLVLDVQAWDTGPSKVFTAAMLPGASCWSRSVKPGSGWWDGTGGRWRTSTGRLRLWSWPTAA